MSAEETRPTSDTPAKAQTSWVIVILLVFFVGLMLAASWFYLNFLTEKYEPSLAKFSFTSSTAAEEEYKPQDIKTTEFNYHEEYFDETDLKAQSYIYARDHLLQIGLMSGIGPALVIDKNLVADIAAEADPNGHFTLPDNIQYLLQVALEAYPNYHKDYDPNNFFFANLFSPEDHIFTSDVALGYLILMENDWGKHFQQEKFFGPPTDKNYAKYRVMGRLMIEAAKKQSLRLNEDPDRPRTVAGDYVLAAALMSVSDTLNSDSLLGYSDGNPFQDVEAAATIQSTASELLKYAKTPVTAEDMAYATMSLGIYGSIDASGQEEIIRRFKLWYERLDSLDLVTFADKAWAVVAYMEIGKRLNDPIITDEGWAVYEKMKDYYMPDEGLMYEQKFYTAEEIAAMLQMLNRINLIGGKYWDQREVTKWKLEYFERMVNQSGIQRSYFPPEDFPVPENLFGEDWEYPKHVKETRVAGGEYGKPPIIGHKVWYNEDKWYLLEDKYFSDEGLYFAYIMQSLSSDYFTDVKNWSLNGNH